MSGEGRSEAVVYQCVYRDRGLTPGCAAFDQRKRARCAGCGWTLVRGHAVLVLAGDGLARGVVPGGGSGDHLELL